MEAVRQNSIKDAKELLARGAGWNPKSKEQWSPMQWAACYGYEELIRLLISKHMAEPYLLSEKKTSKNIDDFNGVDFKKPEIASVVGKYTPLHWATYKGHLRIVWLLLKEKMSINDIDIYGNTSIHQAVASGKIEMLECFLSFGADLQLQNARGHTPIDLATDASIKELIKKALDTQKCKRCETVVFDFENLRYYCQRCKRFFCKACCEIAVYDYEFHDSKEKEKPYTRCIECSQKIRSLQDQLQTALGFIDFKEVNAVYTEAIEFEPYITPKLWHDFIKIHTKLKHELEIHTFIKSLDVIDDYKTILKSCKILSNKEEDAKKTGVELSSMIMKEINSTNLRLTNERNLRFFLDNLDSNNASLNAVNELVAKMQSAENTKVGANYLELAKKTKDKMVENLEAKSIFDKLTNYPVREYPAPEVKDPKKRAPKKEEDKKKKGVVKKKKKEPPFPIPEWAKELTAVISEVSKMDSLVKKAETINLEQDFVKKVQVELARFKKEIGFRKRQEEEARLEAEARAAAKKKAKSKAKK
jgi:hypothetical protein